MPTMITPFVWNLFPLWSKARSVALSVLTGFLSDPLMSRIDNWNLIGATVSFANLDQLSLVPLEGAIVNLCIDFNILPVIQYYNAYLQVGTREMDTIMINFVRDFLVPYWQGSPSGHLVNFDPRTVSVESLLVPDARLVADATTYVFNYLTPPLGSPSKTVNNKNLTITGNSTQVATLKMANSTAHLETNITKRASITCQDFYPNILPFLQGGPMTTVGSDTISCAA